MPYVPCHLAAGDEKAALSTCRLQKFPAVNLFRNVYFIALGERLRILARQQLHQMAAERLGIQNIVFDSARVGKAHADLGVVKFRPEDAGRIQKQQPAVHIHPLLAARHAGAVFRLCALASGNLVDKGRLSDVRNTERP